MNRMNDIIYINKNQTKNPSNKHQFTTLFTISRALPVRSGARGEILLNGVHSIYNNTYFKLLHSNQQC